MNNIYSLVFDLDGTLIDTSEDMYLAVCKLACDYNLQAPPFEKVHAMIGTGVQNMLASVLSFQHKRPPDLPSNEALIQALQRNYDELHAATVPFPMVVKVLAELKQREVLIGVCTNRKRESAQGLLRKTGLESYIDCLVGCDDVVFSKPNPGHLLTVYNLLGVRPSIMIGDTATDAETAERAGLPFLLFCGGRICDSRNEIRAAGIFSTYATLLPLLEEINIIPIV
ncbi:HAD family hydrolase [Brucella pseudogrignonensis]